jgi:peptidyl-prolyl cis-trans isomerase SurA
MCKHIKIVCCLFLLIACSSFTSNLFGQEKQLEGSNIDKIVAVVGNEIIMQSDLDGQLALYAQQDPSIKLDDPTIRQKVLDALINEKLVIAKALEDSLTVTEEEIEQGWNYQLANLVKRYGNEKRVEDIYGMSITRIKNDNRDEIRKLLLAQKLRAREFGEVKVSQREVEDFFAQYKDSLPEVPDQVELYHLVKNV